MISFLHKSTGYIFIECALFNLNYMIRMRILIKHRRKQGQIILKAPLLNSHYGPGIIISKPYDIGIMSHVTIREQAGGGGSLERVDGLSRVMGLVTGNADRGNQISSLLKAGFFFFF